MPRPALTLHGKVRAGFCVLLVGAEVAEELQGRQDRNVRPGRKEGSPPAAGLLAHGGERKACGENTAGGRHIGGGAAIPVALSGIGGAQRPPGQWARCMATDGQDLGLSRPCGWSATQGQNSTETPSNADTRWEVILASPLTP